MYKRIFKEKNSLTEMATIGRISELTITVYTDHGPPHFHVIKKDGYEVRIRIDNFKILDYKWQKKGKEISSSDMNTLKIWLTKHYFKDRSITNYSAIKFAWEIMNEN